MQPSEAVLVEALSTQAPLPDSFLDFTGRWKTRDGREVQVNHWGACYWEGSLPGTPVTIYWDNNGVCVAGEGLDLMERVKERR